MIRIDEVLVIEGVTVYRDETQRNLFYAIPNQPRFRLDDAGLPVFKFIKYRQPQDRPDGSKGGGFVIFDSEFVVPADKLKKVQSQLDSLVDAEKIVKGPAQLGQLTYTRGTATLQLLDSGKTLVEKITSGGKPSLFGNNVACFTAELSPEGATILEGAMQGGGGVAQVIYDLHFVTKIPPFTAHVWFRADKFYSYWQQISKTDSHWWNGNSGEYKDSRREQFRSSDSGGVDLELNFKLPDDDTDKKVKQQISDWAWSTLEDATKRLVLSDPTANTTDTGLPDGVNYVTRDFETFKSASFDRYIKESDAIEWELLPQGTLPNITSIPGIDPKKYFIDVDVNDPFFQTLNVNVGVNADFAKYGIDSIDFALTYNGNSLDAQKDSKGVPLVPHFTSPDQRVTYSQYIDNNNWKYSYSYQVQYKGDERVYKSAVIESDAKVLTINVGDLGVLSVEVIAGGINWAQVAQADIYLSYEDPGSNVDRIEKQFTLTKADSNKHWLAVIMAPRTQPVSYRVKYTMLQGDDVTVAEQTSTAPEIYIDDPFYTKAIHVRSLGDFASAWDTVFLDLTYTDSANNYVQKAAPALTKANQFFDWTFPVLTGSKGTLSYSGRIKRQDGTILEIKPTTSTDDTIYINEPGPPQAFMDVTIVPDLLDWTQIKLVTVKMSYADGNQNDDQNTSIAVKPNAAPPPWRIKVTDKKANSFSWQATFYLKDGSSRASSPTTTSDTNVVLQLPST